MDIISRDNLDSTPGEKREGKSPGERREENSLGEKNQKELNMSLENQWESLWENQLEERKILEFTMIRDSREVVKCKLHHNTDPAKSQEVIVSSPKHTFD